MTLDDIDDPIPLDRDDIAGLRSIAEWFSGFPNDDYKGDGLFIEDIISKVAPLVREIESLNMELTKQRSIYRELLAGFEQLQQERDAPQPAVPEGYILVPVEPTDEMIDAGADAIDGYRVDVMRAYEAMIDASRGDK